MPWTARRLSARIDLFDDDDMFRLLSLEVKFGAAAEQMWHMKTANDGANVA